MPADQWSKQEGLIVEGLVCGFGYADATVTEGTWLKFGASAADRVAVTPATAVGQSFCYALKTADAGDPVPFLLSGIVKVTTNETLAIGSLVLSESVTEVAGIGASNTLYINSATQAILGFLLQESLTPGTEVLMVLGHLQGLV